MAAHHAVGAEGRRDGWPSPWRKTKIGDLAKEAESKMLEWLVVLARCFRLQEAIAVLELDRVPDASLGELDGHRLGLKAAQQDRLELISRSTALNGPRYCGRWHG
ncbi:hypothetical protein [Streptomyces antnestii]|uniref:hypothetical protein n=1 Tax=Streptomyces antnestii TaxID=2494256 RepID=UPI001678E44F|nr:hypothetical protein [Streptomyces sp. San01]